jgi:hypothetical protein
MMSAYGPRCSPEADGHHPNPVPETGKPEAWTFGSCAQSGMDCDKGLISHASNTPETSTGTTPDTIATLGTQGEEGHSSEITCSDFGRSAPGPVTCTSFVNQPLW